MKSLFEVHAGRDPAVCPMEHNFKVKLVTCGAFITIIVTEDDEVFAQRKYDDSELVASDNWTLENPFTMLDLPVKGRVLNLKSGYNFSMLHMINEANDEQVVLSLGSNSQGQLARNIEPHVVPLSQQFQPCIVEDPTDCLSILNIDCGSMHSALTDSTHLYTSGWNKYHQCCPDSSNNILLFRRVSLPYPFENTRIKSVQCTLNQTIIQLSSVDILIMGDLDNFIASGVQIGQHIFQLEVNYPIAGIGTHYSSERIALIPASSDDKVREQNSVGVLSPGWGFRSLGLNYNGLFMPSNQFSILVNPSNELIVFHQDEDQKSSVYSLKNYNIISISTHVDLSGLVLAEYKPESHFKKLDQARRGVTNTYDITIITKL